MGFKKYVRSRLGSALSPLYADCVREQYEKCRFINENLPWVLADTLVRKSRDRRQIETFFTVTSLNEELQTGYSTIAKYLNHAFT
jgi:hypothetical protein